MTCTSVVGAGFSVSVRSLASGVVDVHVSQSTIRRTVSQLLGALKAEAILQQYAKEHGSSDAIVIPTVQHSVRTRQGQCLPYLQVPDSTPFFSGAQVVKEPSLGTFLKEHLEDSDEDDVSIKSKNAHMRSCVCVFLNCHKFNDEGLKELYIGEVASHRFVQSMLKIRSTNRKTAREKKKRLYEVEAPTTAFAIALAFKSSFREHLLAVLSALTMQ